MIWLLLLGLLYAAPPISSYLDTIGVSILSTDSITKPVCIISNKTIPYFANLYNDGIYDNVKYVSPTPEWCREFNGTYLLKTEPTSILTLYGAVQGPPQTFCVEFQNGTIQCSNNTFSTSYNISVLAIADYDGQTLRVISNSTIFLYWNDLSGYNYLGNCSVIPPALNTTPNYIPYGESDNLLFYILGRFTNSSITYIYQTDPDFNYLGYCRNVVVLNAPVNLAGPVRSALVISDYNRNLYPYENGISVLALNNSWSPISSVYQKPEFALPSEAMLDGINYTLPEIATGFTAVAALYIQSHSQATLWELKPLLLATSNRTCDALGCGGFNATMALWYKPLSIYLHPNTKTNVYLSVPEESLVLYSSSLDISFEATNASQYNNIFFSQYPGASNITVNITNPTSEFVPVVLVYLGDLLSLTSNRTYYRGYYETATLNIKNNNPTLPFYIEGISVELWNSTGKIVDLYSGVVEVSIKPGQNYILPISFYIPNDVPDGYVKIKLYSKHTLKGLPLWQKGIEPEVLPGFNISPLNLTGFTAYKLDIPYYGFVDLRDGIIDLDYLTKANCLVLDEQGQTVSLLVADKRYILACNQTLLKPITLYITYEYDSKNATTPSDPPLSIILNKTTLYTNTYNMLEFTVINRQLIPMQFDALLLTLFNSSHNFTYGLGYDIVVEPGENLYRAFVFLPDLPYDGFRISMLRSEEQERAGKGSVYYEDYNEKLPVQRLAFGLTQHLSFWVDNITEGVALSFRRPSTECSYSASPESGKVIFTINGENSTYTGKIYSCGLYSYYVDSSYSSYQTLQVRPGYNWIKYTITPDLSRLYDPYTTEIKFSQGIKMKTSYRFNSENQGSIVHQSLPILSNSSLPYNITTSAKLAEGFMNKLYISIKNNMEHPIHLAYVEIKLGNYWIGGKKYNIPLLPNETFTDTLYLYGVIRNSSQLTINYIFSYDYDPVAYKLPIPTYIGVCDGLFGSYPCLKENTTFIAQTREYDFDSGNWFMGLIGSGEKRWIFRIPLYIPDYLRTLSIYTQDMEDIYYSAPGINPILLDEAPKSGYYLNFPASTFFPGPGIITMVSKGGAPRVHFKYYFAINETLNVSNPGVLEFLPSTLYYYNFQDQVYLKIENRNPVPLTAYFVQYYGDGDFKEPHYTGFLRADAFSNATTYFHKPLSIPHNFENIYYQSGISDVVITHLGRSMAYYATNISQLNLSLASGYNAYVFQGGISKDFEGYLDLEGEYIPINLSQITWENSSKLLFIPRFETPAFLVGDFILYTNATEGYLNATRGQFFISGRNCTAVLGDLCSLSNVNFSSMGVEAYYLAKDISLPLMWRRGIADINLASRSEFDLSYWPMEDMVPGEYLYAMRLYIPTNVYKLYLPAASVIYINGLEANQSQLLTYLVYGDDNNIIYTSDASNPYAMPIIIYGLPTVYSSFDVRNISVYPGGYRYVGAPRPFTFTFNITNNGNLIETINVTSNFTNTTLVLPELESQVINISVPALPEGDYLYWVNISTHDGEIEFLLPIVLNISTEYIDFYANISPALFNLTVPDNATGTIHIYSNSTRPIVVSIGVDSSGVDVVDQVSLDPGETKTIVFRINSLYFGESKNLTFTLTSSNITKNLTTEVIIYNPVYYSNISFDIWADPTYFNLTRPDNATGTLYITSNSSETLVYSIYTDHPSISIQSYVVIPPNNTTSIPFTISSLYLSDNITAHIFVRTRNITKNVSLNISIYLPEPLLEGNYTYPDNRLRLVLDKTLLCVGESTLAYVYDGFGRYVDGAEIITSLDNYIANEGKATISFDRPGSFYVRARMDGYNDSRTIYVLVEECKEETINRGNLTLKELSPQAEQTPPPVLELTYSGILVPTKETRFLIDAPERVLANTSSFIRVYDLEGRPYVGIIKVVSPSGQVRYYRTDNKGYALVYYDELGEYSYEVIHKGKAYPGPKTLATAYIEGTSVSLVRSLPLWPLWALLLALLAWFVVKVEIIARKEGKLIGRVVNILGMPVKDAEISIKLPDKVITTHTDNNGMFKANVGVQKAKISVKWKVAFGDRTSEHEKMDG